MKWPVRRQAPIDLLKYAGLFTWGCAGIPLIFQNWLLTQPLPHSDQLAWLLLHFSFAAFYWQQVKLLPGIASPGSRVISLIMMTACALLISYITGSGLGGVLLLVVAGLLPWMFAIPVGMSWLLGQNTALAAVVTAMPQTTFSGAATIAGLFLGVSLFAFTVSVVAMRNIRARDELRKVNSELRATQALLAENTRIAERVRIARELHDLVGHHLTALTLNLEVVTHLVDGKLLEHVQQAHSLAKLLLADVREVVSDMRRDDKVDLAQALQTLIEGVPQPRIQLDLPEDLAHTDPQRAQILLRCAQEMITNSVRHARARNLTIQLRSSKAGLSLTAKDDGRGTKEVQAGNGLKGMAERLKQLGGSLKIESKPGEGFTLYAWMPMEAET